MPKPDRDFKVGDRIRYECRPSDPPLPRWDLDTDHGPSGNFKHGTIVKAEGSQAKLELSNKRTLFIPQPSHVGWENHWDNPGWYELVEEREEKKVLTQSLRRQRVRSCDCGGSSVGAKHYSWCDVLK